MIGRASKAWHGVRLHQPDWGEHSHSLALFTELQEAGVFVYMILNAYWGPLEFELPPVGNGQRMAPLDRYLPRISTRHRFVGDGALAVRPSLSG